MITGSAPIAPHVMNFLRAAFGVPVHEGYGQTESSAAITFTEPTDFTVGHVGGPIAANEIMLEDVVGDCRGRSSCVSPACPTQEVGSSYSSFCLVPDLLALDTEGYGVQLSRHRSQR